MARTSCLDCVRKHIAQASILMDEASLGYPLHKWYAVGHLAEAESESLQQYPELSIKIRECRLSLMNKNAEVCFDKLLINICRVAKEDEYLKFDKNNSKKIA